MKLFRILSVTFFAAMFVQIFALWNLKVSYKYEVDLADTHVKVSNMTALEKKKEYAHNSRSCN
jgi:hypothetical protein